MIKFTIIYVFGATNYNMFIFNRINTFFLTILKRTNIKQSGEKLKLMHFLWLTSFGFFIGIFFFFYSIFFQNLYISMVILFFLLVMFFSVYLLYKGIDQYIVYSSTNLLFLMVLTLFITFPSDVSSRILWSYIYPIASIFLFGYKIGIRWSLAMLLSIFLSFFLIKEVGSNMQQHFLIRFIITYLSVVCIVSWLEFYKNKFQNELEHEIQKRKELEQKLISLANTDELTGLLNRRYFWEEGKNELERSKRYGHSFSLGILDIDYFKDINDNYGHLVGDKVLKEVSIFCKQFLRSSDFLARVGGEEFAFILLNVTAKEAESKFEKLRKDISDLIIEVDDTKLNITVSIGISSPNSFKEDVSLEKLYNCSDEALYEAKKTGRNKVIAYTN